MNINDYTNYMSSETLMGPNSARVLEELFKKYPLQLEKDDTVLDLGCGKGLTSLVIAKETGAKVYANDLWIGAEDNKKRFENWGVGEQIFPVCEDANNLSFEKRQFDALISIDSYHYFATKAGFFEDKILPFLKDKAVVLIGIFFSGSAAINDNAVLGGSIALMVVGLILHIVLNKKFAE